MVVGEGRVGGNGTEEERGAGGKGKKWSGVRGCGGEGVEMARERGCWDKWEMGGMTVL